MVEKVKKAKKHYITAYRSLHKEQLVAGKHYGAFVNSLMIFMQLGVLLDFKVPEGKDKLSVFQSGLDKIVNLTISNIDEADLKPSPE